MRKNLTFQELDSSGKKRVSRFFLERYNVAVDTGKFDMIKFESIPENAPDYLLEPERLPLNSIQIEPYLDLVVLIEVKSTRKNLDPDFSGFFFGITYDEVIVAQKLESRGKYLIAMVSEQQDNYLILPWSELLRKVKKLYMQFSLQL